VEGVTRSRLVLALVLLLVSAMAELGILGTCFARKSPGRVTGFCNIPQPYSSLVIRNSPPNCLAILGRECYASLDHQGPGQAHYGSSQIVSSGP
jgi:hypothetical protein